MPEAITKSDSSARIPSWLQDIYSGPQGIAQQLKGVQSGLPSLSELPGQIPGLNVPGLTPEQLALINQLTTQGTDSPDVAAARAQIGQLTSGPIGYSPATQAGMKAFTDLIAPQIEQASALRGTASGGEAIEALQQGATAAALPLIQQEIRDREAAVGQNLAVNNTQVQNLAAALEVQGMPREVALQKAQAAYDQLLKKAAMEAQLQEIPLGQLSKLIGESSSSKAHDTNTAEDWIGGGLQVIGSLFG